MVKTSPIISQFMTPMPYTIEADASLSQAIALFNQFKIHHLPVTLDSKIIGLLSQHDLNILATHDALLLEALSVREAMFKNPYCVSPETKVGLVASHMAENKLNAALIVQEDGALIGIFTDADALRALAEIFQARHEKTYQQVL